MERYFDAFLYLASWGTHLLKLRTAVAGPATTGRTVGQLRQAAEACASARVRAIAAGFCDD
jgi:hypothetical protein